MSRRSSDYMGNLPELVFKEITFNAKQLADNMERMITYDITPREMFEAICKPGDAELLLRAAEISRENDNHFGVERKITLPGDRRVAVTVGLGFNDGRFLMPNYDADKKDHPAYAKLDEYLTAVYALRSQWQMVLDVLEYLNKTLHHPDQWNSVFPVMRALMSRDIPEKLALQLTADTTRRKLPALHPGFKDIAKVARMTVTTASIMPQLQSQHYSLRINLPRLGGVPRPWLPSLKRGVSL